MLQWLFSWWNLIFLIPFVFALLYLVLYTMTGITFGEADADADAHVEADAHVDADADGDVSADADGDVSADADADADAQVDAHAETDASTEGDGHADGDDHAVAADHTSGAEVPLFLALSSWVGVGKAPVSLVLLMLMMVWGATGLLINQLGRERAGQNPAMLAAISVPAALLAALLASHFLSALIGRFFPTVQTSARRKHELLGSTGEALFRIDGSFGMACGRDDRGDFFQIPCRTDRACPPIDKGQRIKLVAYNVKDKLFLVVPDDNKGGHAVASPTQTKER